MKDQNIGDQIKDLVLKIAKDMLAGTDGWQRVDFHLSFNAKNVQGGIRLADFDFKTEMQANQRKVDKEPVAKEGWRRKKKPCAAELHKASVRRTPASKNLTSRMTPQLKRGRPRKDDK